MILDKAYHFGSAALPAPQAGLMAMLAKASSAATWLGRW
jgi:hypothetical protein